MYIVYCWCRLTERECLGLLKTTGVHSLGGLLTGDCVLLFRKLSEGGCLTYPGFCALFSTVKARCDCVHDHLAARARAADPFTPEAAGGPGQQAPGRTARPEAETAGNSRCGASDAHDGPWRLPDMLPPVVRRTAPKQGCPSTDALFFVRGRAPGCAALWEDQAVSS